MASAHIPTRVPFSAKKVASLEVALTVTGLRGLVDPATALASSGGSGGSGGSGKKAFTGEVTSAFRFDPFVRAWTTLTPRGGQVDGASASSLGGKTPSKVHCLQVEANCDVLQATS